ncbi:hypothetical protein RRG08_056145 [Elysia crispata]|uniref:Uncharacterized protein n=1 Tax=Elysia crispata TaxID=231223 RepID=A0AAE0YT17_9GAST|nr:hypothetical protein RRG08_056145 [Elysia crispata]
MVIFGLPEPEAPMSTNRIFEGCGLTSAPAQGIFCVDASLSLSLQALGLAGYGAAASHRFRSVFVRLQMGI